MKYKLIKTLVLIGFLPLSGLHGYSQGFINFDFESPILPLVPINYEVPITNAMPGWSGYIDGISIDRVGYDAVNLGAAGISFHGPESRRPILEGSYMAILQGSSAATPTSAAIGQIGQIPADSLSLRFFGDVGNVLELTFSSQLIPCMAIGTGPNYTIYGADISAFAGQTGQLLFTAPPFGGGMLDNIQFSDEPVPEPSALGLLAMGGLILGWKLRRK